MATADCPFDPQSTNYSVGTGLDTVAVQLEGGAGRYRADYLGTTFIVTVEWSLDATEYDALMNFYLNTIKRGSRPFNINLMVASYLLQQHVAYVVPGSFKLGSQQGNSFVVNATLEVSPKANLAQGPLLATVGGSFDIALSAHTSGHTGPDAGYTYGFSLPSSASVKGIVVSLQRKKVQSGGPEASININAIQLYKAGVIVGSMKSSALLWTNDYTVEVFGGENDLWGTSWIYSDINDPFFGFEIGLAYDNESGAEVDAVGDTYQITVYYTS